MSTVTAGGSEAIAGRELGRSPGARCSTLARMSSESAPWAGQPVAIVHDWFQGYHGSERVVEVLADDVLAEAGRVDVLTFHAARELLPPKLGRADRPRVAAVAAPRPAPDRPRPRALALPPPLHAASTSAPSTSAITHWS